MLKLAQALVFAGALVSFSSESFADIDSDLSNICTIVKNDDKSELRKKVSKIKKEHRLRLGEYYERVTCSGQSLIRHAMIHSANAAGTYLIKTMRKSDLNKPESDGKTLKQWAEENGHIGSPLGTALLDRLG